MLDHSSTQLSLQGFDGRVALVTGAARGIGRRIAETFLALGARVAAFDLDRPEVPGALGLAMDVTDPASVAWGTALAESELGPSSIIVTSAGIFTPCAFDELELSAWRRTIDVNVTGTYTCVRHVLPAMCERGHGRVVTVSSMGRDRRRHPGLRALRRVQGRGDRVHQVDLQGASRQRRHCQCRRSTQHSNPDD